jgi:hypothetical protein
MSPAYKYEALPTGKWIRLLRLFPGINNDPIHLELFPTKMETAPPYEAISYCWGDPGHQDKVTCSGKTVYITKSLFTGLKCFRHPEEARILWADAICIDQSNDKEKGHQVNMMANIYDRAHRVLVWLGGASNLAGEKAFRLIRAINEYIDSKIVESELVIHPWAAVANVPRLENRNQLFQDNSETEALYDLFCRPWFSRVWVLQEVALASSACLFYGSTSISFSEIIQAAFILSSRPDLQDNFPVGPTADAFVENLSTYTTKETWIHEKTLLRHLQSALQRQPKQTFEDVLENGSRFKATKPLDHIFAFLGHPSAERKDGTSILEANYILSAEKTCQRLVQNLYARNQRLDFLVCVSHLSLGDMEDFPSWVPKFHKEKGGRSPNTIDHRGWDADRSAETEKLLKANFLNGMLHCRGLIFDSIAAWSETFNWLSFKRGPSPVEICWSLSSSFVQHADSEKWWQAFGFTLVAGGYAGGEAPLQRDFNSYCHEKASSHLCAAIPKGAHTTDDKSLVKGNWMQFERNASIKMQGRRFFATKDGSFGLGPSLLQDGDVCCVVLGCRMPLVIRPTSTARYFRVLGPCYIKEAMYGGLVAARVESPSNLSGITLV